jgi:formylglycine-generating enzyme required for sulfatase activity
MRSILFLVTVPALVIGALALAGRAQDVPHKSEPPLRPNPIPEINGMVFVPAGEFAMGTTAPELLKTGEVDEFPQRRIFVDDFYIDIREVNNAEYKVFLDSTHVDAPPKWIDGNYGMGEDGFPVISVSWDEATAYAKWVGKRLPTEAEWEKAARGTDGRAFPWGNSFDRALANNSDRLMPVMSYTGGTSPYGCYDMAGNAAEWVDGQYEAYPRGPDDVLPKGVPDRNEMFSTERRVYRGGSWNTFSKYLRCANREHTSPGKRWVYVGFRCAMDPPWKADTTRKTQP